MKKLALLAILVVSLLSCKAQATPELTATPVPTATQLASTPETVADESSPEPIIRDIPLTIVEVEELAGFDVREPTYLPKGVSFEYATYEQPGFPGVNLQYKFTHEQYGDMGHFFLISQQQKSEAPPDAVSCGESTEGCEIIQIGDMTVVYNEYKQPEGHAATEGFAWYTDGVFFRLHRMAGEPNKVYKEELLKVVKSMLP
ncbi:MAG TPA: DUF4367 domain-containing protein [Anaerolineales bacterium]|nr:DUF4367 domain-containing protein [Anaerolineales bacterium]